MDSFKTLKPKSQKSENRYCQEKCVSFKKQYITFPLPVFGERDYYVASGFMLAT